MKIQKQNKVYFIKNVSKSEIHKARELLACRVFKEQEVWEYEFPLSYFKDEINIVKEDSIEFFGNKISLKPIYTLIYS